MLCFGLLVWCAMRSMYTASIYARCWCWLMRNRNIRAKEHTVAYRRIPIRDSLDFGFFGRCADVQSRGDWCDTRFLYILIYIHVYGFYSVERLCEELSSMMSVYVQRMMVRRGVCTRTSTCVCAVQGYGIFVKGHVPLSESHTHEWNSVFVHMSCV